MEHGQIERFILVHEANDGDTLVVGEARFDAPRVVNHMPGCDGQVATGRQEGGADKVFAEDVLDVECDNRGRNSGVELVGFQFCPNWERPARQCEPGARCGSK